MCIRDRAYSTIQSVFEEADVIYFTGGNSFFLMDQLRKTGADGLLKKELANGKLMIGESAGAIICAPSIQYIEQMDEKDVYKRQTVGKKKVFVTWTGILPNGRIKIW